MTDAPSDLRRYLERLANGPILDPVMSATRVCQLHAAEGSELATGELTKRRTAFHQRYMNAKPLVVRKARKR